MPPHLHYVEPYFGGGSVLLARDPSRDWMAGDQVSSLPAALRGASEVVNDVHGELTNFWRVLKDPQDFGQFRLKVELTPFSEAEFQLALEESSAEDRSLSAAEDSVDSSILGEDRVTRAVRFFILARQSRQGLMRDFATLSRNRTRSRINEQVSAWLRVVEGLPEIHNRLQSVVILNQEACDVIRRQDGPHTLFYCDPPYLHETRSTVGEYRFEMTKFQHVELLETLAKIEGKFMLSGYPSQLYLEWQNRFGWNRHEQTIDNKAAAGKVKEQKIECLWCNF